MAKDSTPQGEKKKNRWSQLLREFPQVESIAPGEPQQKKPRASAGSGMPRPAVSQPPLKTQTNTKGTLTLEPLEPQGKSKPATVSSSEKPKASFEFPEDQELDTDPEEHVYSVSEVNRAVKQQLEGEFQGLWLQGEISNFKAHTSGHFYFSLKDSKAQISAVMFRGINSKLKFTPESGMEVLVRGKITVYEPRGNYQFFCEHMEPVGAGALQKAFEQLKAKLKGEGLFEDSRKQKLPAMPQKVGVLTSPTGAAIRDILNVLGRRSPRVEVTVIPARVQGTTAAGEIAKGIALANKVGGFDVLIIGRGGGSIEDLWCFNEEVVARAIAASTIPIISAVGHEIDFTISDFVADLRAPTPSAAAEVVAQSEEQIKNRLQFSLKALTSMIQQKIGDHKNHLDFYSQRLKDPRAFLRDSVLRCDELTLRLTQGLKSKMRQDRLRVKALEGRLQSPQLTLDKSKLRLENLQRRLRGSADKTLIAGRRRLQQASAVLDSLSPLKVIDRGYAIVKVKDQIVRSVKDHKVGDLVDVQVQDGHLVAEVKSIETNERKS